MKLFKSTLVLVMVFTSVMGFAENKKKNSPQPPKKDILPDHDKDRGNPLTNDDRKGSDWEGTDSVIGGEGDRSDSLGLFSLGSYSTLSVLVQLNSVKFKQLDSTAVAAVERFRNYLQTDEGNNAVVSHFQQILTAGAGAVVTVGVLRLAMWHPYGRVASVIGVAGLAGSSAAFAKAELHQEEKVLISGQKELIRVLKNKTVTTEEFLNKLKESPYQSSLMLGLLNIFYPEFCVRDATFNENIQACQQ